MDLETQFYKLSGRTIGEYTHNFNIFKNSLFSSNQDEQNQFLDSLQPRNLQEQLFYIKLLYQYEKYEKLMSYFEDEHIILHKVITKHHKMDELVKHINAEQLLSKICPNLSYVIRNRFIKKLANVTEHGEQLFNMIFQYYGLRTAMPLLLTCTQDFIQTKITNYNIKFNAREMIKLYQLYPNLVDFYFKNNHQLSGHTEFDLLGQYLALNDVAMFYKLLQYGVPSIGAKAFKSFLSNYKNDVIKNPTRYSNILKPKIIKSVLTIEEFKEFFKNFLPLELNNGYIYQGHFKFIKCYSIRKRGTLLYETFNEKYGVQLYEQENKIDQTLLEHLSLEDRQKFDLKLEKYVQLNCSEECFKILTGKMNFTQAINERVRYLKLMIDSCRINKDIDGFLNVLQYFIKRHKNDVKELRESFLSHALQAFSFELWGEEHFKCINDIRMILEVNDDSIWCTNEAKQILNAYKCKHNLDLTDSINDHIERVLNAYATTTPHHQVEHLFIEQYAERINEYVNHKEYYKIIGNFFEFLVYYNDKYPKNYISYYNYMHIIKKYIENENCWNQGYNIKTILSSPERNIKASDEFLEYVMENHLKTATDELLIYFLKYKPSTLQIHLKALLNLDQQIDTNFVYIAMKMHYTEIPKILHEIAYEFLQCDNKDYVKISNALSILTYDDNFIEIISKFAPKDDCVMDPNTKGMKDLLYIQRHIIRCLKSYSNLSESMKVALHYCNKDYFQYALSILYYGMCNMRQSKIDEIIDVLLTRSVTVRKHAIALINRIGTVVQISDVLKKLGCEEKNASVRMYLFQGTFNAFFATGNEEIYHLIMPHLESLHPDANKDIIFDLQKIHFLFIRDYVENIWNYLIKLEKKQEYRLLNIISDKIVKCLSHEFCINVIQHAFDDLRIASITNFTFSYLVHSGIEMSERVETVFEFLNKSNDNLNIKDKLNQSKQSKELLTLLTYRLLSDRKENQTECENLAQNMKIHIDKLGHEHIYNKICINLLAKTLKMKENFIDELVAYLSNELVSLLTIYGKEMFYIACDYLKEMVGRLLLHFEGSNTLQSLELAKGIWMNGEIIELKLLAIELMPNVVQSEMHLNLIKDIQADQSLVVSISLEKYLKQCCIV